MRWWIWVESYGCLPVRPRPASGQGGFGPPLSYSIPPQAKSIELGDLDGDGLVEIVTCHATGTVAVFPNLGGGSFGAALRTTVGGELESLALGDLDGDGFTDVVTVGNPTSLSLLRGRGDLGFAPRETTPLGGDRNTAVETVDLDRDGDLDVVVGRDSDSSVLTEAFLLRNAGDASFERDVLRTVTAPIDLAAGDVDRDGWNDLCFVSRQADTVSCYRSDRAGGFEFGQLAAVPSGNRARVADLDADGHLDVALLGVSQLVTWFGKGDGGFRAPIPFAIPALYECVLNDLDRDDVPDLITVEAAGMRVYRGRGDGTFEVRSTHPTRLNQYVALGRVDRDTLLDVLVLGDSGAGSLIQCFRGNAAGSFENSRAALQTAFYCEQPASGDLNGDGIIDLVLPHFFIGQVEVHLGTGDGRFRLLARLTLPGPPVEVLIADVDQDKAMDLVFACWSQGRTVVFPGRTGGFGSPRTFVVDRSPMGLLAEDLDLDGTRDLLIGHESSLAFLRGDGQRGFLQPSSFAAGPCRSLASGDFDEDGLPDLVLGGDGMTLLRNQGFH